MNELYSEHKLVLRNIESNLKASKLLLQRIGSLTMNKKYYRYDCEKYSCEEQIEEYISDYLKLEEILPQIMDRYYEITGEVYDLYG